MTDMRYEPIIHWSKQDNAFLVEVPELPGCMAATQKGEGCFHPSAVALA